MSSVKKGNAFEDEVFDYLQDELQNDRLFVTGKMSKIFQKKGYYSRDRDKDIITDISIETYLSGAADYSLLTVIECKDYNHSIPVDDLEEFHSKVQQITGVNVKAIFFTTAALQQSALNFAKSKKIAVVRYLPPSQVTWEMHYLTANSLSSAFRPERLKPSEFNSAFLNQSHTSKGRTFYGCDEEYLYGSLFSLLKEYVN